MSDKDFEKVNQEINNYKVIGCYKKWLFQRNK